MIQQVHDQKHNRVYKNFRRFYKVSSVICCLALVSILLLAVSYLPPVGSGENPSSNEVAAKYIEDGLQDTGAVNIVTGMILDYRAFDTFGESNVLFIATCTVLILLRSDKKKDKRQEEAEQRREQHYEPKDDSILQRVTFLLFPVIVIFGIYVILNGHISPGGGFSGGAIMGAGLILCSLGLMLFFRLQMQLGVKNAQQTFEILAQMLPDRTTGIPGGYAEAAMPALQIGSTDYVALLEIPSAGIALPVANTWDSNKLAFSPARFSGSAYDHTLVIGGADDPGQFGFCDQIDLPCLSTDTERHNEYCKAFRYASGDSVFRRNLGLNYLQRFSVKRTDIVTSQSKEVAY